jgi:hypothetical protein
MLATEDVQGKVTVAAVVAVKETTFLMAVERIIRRIQIQPDLARRRTP